MLLSVSFKNYNFQLQTANALVERNLITTSNFVLGVIKVSYRLMHRLHSGVVGGGSLGVNKK
jgi:hypothetical protein